jgi:hypothetical protein
MVALLANTSNASFHDLLIPLALMTKLTYTATWGSYYNASEANATVVGWVRPPAFTENPPAGMRALLFVQPSTDRAVVAYRGTDLGEGESGEADRCADALLANDTLPAFCGKFAPSTLDYWGAALDYVGRVRSAYPTTDLLFTGHSLGAGLALATAVATSPNVSVAQQEEDEEEDEEKREGREEGEQKKGEGREEEEEETEWQPWAAVAFAAPPWVQILQQEAHLPAPPASAAHQRLYAMADEWDPVQKTTDTVHGHVGTECLWSSLATPACLLCFASEPFNSSATGCELCFSERHIFSHYLNVDVPGDRAVCKDVVGSVSSRPFDDR